MRKAIGIDIGGTKIKGGIIDEEGNILKSIILDTDANKGRNMVLKKVREIIENLIRNEKKVVGIGIGSPGAINIEKGKIEILEGNMYNWSGVNLRTELNSFFDLPIFIENDANLVGLCERWIGEGQNTDAFVVLTLGTGLGGSIYVKDDILHGSDWRCGEIGHTILYPNGRECKCGQKGCTEQYVSGRGIEKTYYEKTGIYLSSKEIFNRCSKGEQTVKETISEFIENLAILIITIKNMIDPDKIIIGGGLVHSRDHWWKPMIDYYNNNCNITKGTTIVTARHLNNSGVIGGGKLVFENISSDE
ncbi:transcriptional regulator/sugar kinase [Gottschalkia purinilytica]|uniref:Transcriptional regulator/sugar kinase n=1 Tax=Gottschalkia purinilytica TaxID=1503 RepID=A0A0L0WDH7_GOTPU|nr:ROK family protein [Gottschalkia purinilytica]KNF09527.1 transcriptional regulator/sugar kinase [Gottschalkia purinilytica]